MKMTTRYYPLYTKGKLHPQAVDVLIASERNQGKPLDEIPLSEIRENFLAKSWLGKFSEDIKITEIEIEAAGRKIPCHAHTPNGIGPFPVLLFFHGGGFVIGEIEEFDRFCSRVASGAGCVVVNAGYRLAPENKYPAALEDARTVMEWIIKNGSEINVDASRIALCGDSAGGNLSAVLSILARDVGIKICGQVLICPWLNLNSFDRNSYKYFGEGYWLSETSIHWFKKHYLQNEGQAGSYLVSPGLMLDVTNLAPALIITAEFDVLADEGAEYASRLKEAGVPVTYSCYKGMLHDFVTLPGLFDDAVKGEKEIVEFLESVFK
jgi:acetyl esterase